MFKNNLQKVNRVSNYRFNRSGYLRLDGNERNFDFTKNQIQKFKNCLSSFLLQAYPVGSEKLTRLIAKDEKISKNYILITPGIDGALKLIFESISYKKKFILSSIWPTYGMISVFSKIFNFQIERILENKKTFDNFLNSKGNCVYIANPNSPSGKIICIKKIEKILEKNYKKGIFVIIDEAYIDFADQKSSNYLVKKYNNLIVLKSFSKSYGLAGIRVGYIITNPKNFRHLGKTKSMFDISAFSLKIAETAIEERNFKKNYLSLIKKNKIYFEDKCKIRNIKHSLTQANFAYIFLEPKKVKKVFLFLMKKKILVKTNFLGNFSYVDNAIRVSLTSSNNLDLFFKYFDLIIKKIR